MIGIIEKVLDRYGLFGAAVLSVTGVHLTLAMLATAYVYPVLIAPFVIFGWMIWSVET